MASTTAIDSNFWFYTLSATPQALAAMVALFASFAAYRLNHINEFIKRDYELARWFLLVMNRSIYSEKLKDMEDRDIVSAFNEESSKLREGDKLLGLNTDQYYGIQNRLSEIIKSYYGSWEYFTGSPDRWAKFIKQRAHIYEGNVRNKSLLYRYLIVSLVATAFPIIFSLIFLPLYSVIPNLYIKIGILALIVIAAVYSVAYIAWRVWTISKL